MQDADNRMAYLDHVLRHLMSGGALPPPSVTASLADDAFVIALKSFIHSWQSNFAAGAELAASALAEADDADARAMARAAANFALAVWPAAIDNPALYDPATGMRPAEAALISTEALSPQVETVAYALLAESALANAHVATAAAFLTRAGATSGTLFGGPHPFLTFIRALRARVAAFEGHIVRAEGWAREAVVGAETPVESLLAFACLALVRGSADQRKETRELVLWVAGAPPPIDAVTRGHFVLAAYGARALGQVEQSAQLLLLAGGDDDLSKLRIIDRAFGLEALMVTALAGEDMDAAESWLARLEVLDGHPIAMPTVERARSRWHLAARDADKALASATRALLLAQSDGRGMEAAEAEILRARAQIAHRQGGTAARELAVLVAKSEAQGYFEIRRVAARELRQIGRRLPPATSSGWSGLSAREREVALLMARGFSNATLAHELFLSQHTVRRHVSRVLCAFGVATRYGVAAAVASQSVAALPQCSLDELTVRQREVVALIHCGASNNAIAEALGVGVSTVEKHVSAIKERWSVTSRAAIAGVADSAQQLVAATQ